MSTVDVVTCNNTGASLPNTQSQTLSVDEVTVNNTGASLPNPQSQTLTVDEVTVNNIWALTDTQNQTLTDGEQKTQFLYRHMREEFIKLEKNIDRKKTDEKDTWTELYQLIGFFSVFQGVWFQGVTQLAAQRTCRFYIIPIILSVLVSVATLVGCFVKFARVRDLQFGFYKDKLQSKVLESRLGGFGRYGLEFNLKKSDEGSKESIAALTTYFEAQLVGAHQIKIIVLAGLTIFSGLFAWLIFAVKKQLKYRIYTMVRSMIVNSCGSVVTIMEGNAGVYRKIVNLKDGTTYRILMDPNTTYREYRLVIEVLERVTLLVTSDDVIEYSIITCIQKPDGEYDLDTTPRQHRKPWRVTTASDVTASETTASDVTASETTASEASEGRNRKWGKITRFFKSLLTGNSSLR